MSITNITKPTTTLANTTKIGTGETWASITTTWATETRTWAGVVSKLTNTTRVSSSMTNSTKP